jgi:hypothetical protein
VTFSSQALQPEYDTKWKHFKLCYQNKDKEARADVRCVVRIHIYVLLKKEIVFKCFIKDCLGKGQDHLIDITVMKKKIINFLKIVFSSFFIQINT